MVTIKALDAYRNADNEITVRVTSADSLIYLKEAGQSTYTSDIQISGNNSDVVVTLASAADGSGLPDGSYDELDFVFVDPGVDVDAVNLGLAGCNPGNLCAEGEADADSTEDCLPGLRVFQRQNGEEGRGLSFPGGFDPTWDPCYDPSYNPSAAVEAANFIIDLIPPEISSTTIANDNSYIDVTFNGDLLFNSSSGSGALVPGDFNLIFMQNYEDWKNWSELNFAEASVEENLYFSKLRKKFKLGDDLDVLEIGYGNGSFLDFSRTAGWNVSGVEAIPELINRASQNNFEVFTNIDDVQKRYDLIVAFDVLEHIKPEELPFFLEKIKKCLNSNGAFIFRTPNGSSPLGLANQHGDATHVNTCTESKMHYWANSSNLNLNYYGGDIFLIYNGNILKTPFRLIKRILQVLIERMVRWIFSPQSKGVLSSNSLYKLTLKK
mgnify:CR=1 FL=1